MEYKNMNETRLLNRSTHQQQQLPCNNHQQNIKDPEGKKNTVARLGERERDILQDGSTLITSETKLNTPYTMT